MSSSVEGKRRRWWWSSGSDSVSCHAPACDQESGLPYTVIRPCALTEEPAGAPLLVEQGDNIKGKISRNSVAEIAVASLFEPGRASRGSLSPVIVCIGVSSWPDSNCHGWGPSDVYPLVCRVLVFRLTAATNLTFEVKSTIPFSQVWEAPPDVKPLELAPLLSPLKPKEEVKA